MTRGSMPAPDAIRGPGQDYIVCEPPDEIEAWEKLDEIERANARGRKRASRQHQRENPERRSAALKQEREQGKKRRDRLEENPEFRKAALKQERVRDKARRDRVNENQDLKNLNLERERASDRKRRGATPPRPFLAIDGEGGRVDKLDRQNYLMMAAANAEHEFVLHRDGAALTTKDCFEFILSLPPKTIMVGYGIGYDATQILRGIPDRALKKIMNPWQGKNGPSYTAWGDYMIIYQQGQYLQVARVDRSVEGPRPTPLKGSCRIINEQLGFFQSSFVKSITDWQIGDAEGRALIALNKGKRNDFSHLTDGMIEYCKHECRYLSLLMTDFRNACVEAGISIEKFRGAGWVASALLKKHRIPKRPLTVRERENSSLKFSQYPRRPERDPDFDIAANLAYYGGRFEISRIGPIAGPVYQYDLRSAYPAAMQCLPCSLHTTWKRWRKKHLPKPSGSGCYVAKVTFSHPPEPRIKSGAWCGFPFREKGGLHWPCYGTGWYWNCEIEAAVKYLHARILKVHEVWVAQSEPCDCKPFDFVPEMYQARRKLGPSTKGYPLKLGLNSLYGKSAQRVGSGPFHDPVSAGLITAITRARLIEAVWHAPDACVMIATDAIFSTRPLPLDIGDGLGQWEEKRLPDLFIVQPGVYWSSTNVAHGKEIRPEGGIKSRGVARSIIGDAVDKFHRGFAQWFEIIRQPERLKIILDERRMPEVPVTVRVFIACRLAWRAASHTSPENGKT